MTEGFTYLKMMSRLHQGDGLPTPPTSSKTPTHPYNWDNSAFGDLKEDADSHLEEEILNVPCEVGNRTTIIVKFKKDFDVMITPLVLESLQRFIDALTPTLATLHVLTVINHLHFECMGKVKDANVLKKEDYLPEVVPTAPVAENRGKDRANGFGSLVQSNVYQECISLQTQGIIVLPRINVTLLQASVVEELTPFSALDNIRDFACVSIFAICLDKVTAKFHFEKQTREIVQTFQRPVVAPSQKKSGILARGARPLSIGGQHSITPIENTYADPVYIESSEKQQSEVIVMLNIGKIHAQLRRLPNECSILKDAVVTAIPSHYSKVMFICKKLSSPNRGVEHFTKPKESAPEPVPDDNGSGDDKLGFIMFESGLEGVSLKVSQKNFYYQE